MLDWRLTPEEQERLNPPIMEFAEDEEGQLYHKITDDPKWLNVGYIPTPQTSLGWFIYHLIHGLAMGYPARKVLIFAIKHASEASREILEGEESSYVVLDTLNDV